MFNKNKRVLWLLNHRTLMPYEAPLIQRLGFEIYIPKIYPKTGFRSGAVDASFDATLTLPAGVLTRLNQFNFYEDEWPADIVAKLNRYFGTAIIIPHARLTAEAIDHFEGQIIFRAFGLDNEQTYRQFLENLYGPLVTRKIMGIKERFWFGEGYDHLHECEEPIYAERSLFLPIGIPDSSFATENQWTGREKKILFVCPNAVTDSYYSKIYKNFKRDFGDLPHVIVGAQDVPVPDPHVAGFVSDAELKRLYLDCAVLYYHSIEVRHIHYSPIEAAINGMPVIFHAGSLLDRLSRNATHGRVSSVKEARDLIERILADDQGLLLEIKEDQREIAYHFSNAYCEAMWRTKMEERGFFESLQPTPKFQTILKEIKRFLMMPLARGRTRINPHKEAVRPYEATLSAEEAKRQFGSSLYDGLQFSDKRFPAAIDYVDGVGADESWGRWSNGPKAVIVLKHFLEGEFRLFVRAVGYRENANVPVAVKIGSEVRFLYLPSRIEEATGAWLHFGLKERSNIIEIEIPHPIRPPQDTRLVGIGFVEVRADPPISTSLSEAQASLGATLRDGIDFRASELPPFVAAASGVCSSEGWGRWTSGARVVIELKHTLVGPVRLKLKAVAYGPNLNEPIVVTVGNQRRSIRFTNGSTAEDEEGIAINFDLRSPSSVIEITIPHPVVPPNDDRAIGLGLIGLSME